ncbi:MAG: hypothetical protein ABF745_01480, partial [Leuconostoc mesenteroides]
MDINTKTVVYVNNLFEQMLVYDDTKEIENERLKNALTGIKKISNNFHSAVGIVIYQLNDEKCSLIGKMFIKEEATFDFLLNSYELEDPSYLKFRDSVILSLAQRQYINESNQKAEKASKRVLKNLKKIKSTKTGIYSDLIAILGIFTAITFATFGATSMLSSVFSHVSNVTVSNLGFIFITAGVYLVCLYALIAVMFVGIHKIIHSEDIN